MNQCASEALIVVQIQFPKLLILTPELLIPTPELLILTLTVWDACPNRRRVVCPEAAAISGGCRHFRLYRHYSFSSWIACI